MRSARSLLTVLALALLAVQVAVGLSSTLLESARACRNLIRFADETPLERRSRVYGPEYTQAIEEIRRTIPVDGAYALVNGEPAEEGAPLWVKLDLAPRRAVYLGDLARLKDSRRLRGRIPRAAHWVVIAHSARDSYGPPEVMTRARFLQPLRGSRK